MLPPGDGELIDNAELALFERNDAGNAKRLFARFGHEMTWVPGYGWRIWNNQISADQQGEGAAYLRAVQTAGLIKAEADELPGEPVMSANGSRKINHREDHRRWSKESGNIQRVRGMLAIAASMMQKDHREFDADPLLLNVQNGTLELHGGKVALREHRREDFITRIASVDYRPGAECPKWWQFIETIFADKDTRRFVQKWFGYCLTGVTIEQVFVAFYGKGANGKSTMIEVISRLMGSYAGTIPVDALLLGKQANAGGPSPEIVKMHGLRLIRTSEPSFGATFNDSVMKQLTGSEEMTGRGLNKDFIDFRAVGKLCLGVNHIPKFRGRDHGTKRRTVIVPCRHQFKRVEGEKRRDYVAELCSEEGPGILNWLLDGYRLWHDEGLLPEAEADTQSYSEIRDQTKAYFTDLDQEGQAVREILVLTNDPNDKISSSDIVNRAERWCSDNAVFKLNKRSLTDALKAFGAEPARFSGGVRGWGGVKINPDLSDSYSAHRSRMRGDDGDS